MQSSLFCFASLIVAAVNADKNVSVRVSVPFFMGLYSQQRRALPPYTAGRSSLQYVFDIQCQETAILIAAVAMRMS